MERGRRGFARLSQRKTEKGVMLVPAAFTYLCWAVVSTAAVGYVPEALEMQHNFARIGFTNSAGEAPYLVQKEQRGNAVILTYHCTGFPVSAWVDKQLELESALNMLIASVKEGNDRRTVSLCCVPPEHVFDTIEWHERYILRNEDNKLILGRGLTGDGTRSGRRHELSRGPSEAHCGHRGDGQRQERLGAVLALAGNSTGRCCICG